MANSCVRRSFSCAHWNGKADCYEQVRVAIVFQVLTRRSL